MEAEFQEEQQLRSVNTKKIVRESGGGKAGAHSYLMERCPELRENLPTNTAHYVPGETSKDNFLEQLRGEYPKIVRPCHPRDTEGLVGVMPWRIARTIEDVSRAIDDVLSFADSDRFHHFYSQEFSTPTERVSYDGNISVLVQDWCGGERGTIIEHPHQRGIFRISHVIPNGRHTFVDEDICLADGRVLDPLHMWEKRSRKPAFKMERIYASPQYCRVISLYRQIEETGIIACPCSFEMEFGFGPDKKIIFYQFRPFRRFETTRSTDAMPGRGISGQKYITLPYDSIGITDRNGVGPMPIAELFPDNVRKKETEPLMVYHRISGKPEEDSSVSVSPQNMMVYMTDDSGPLERNHFRNMKRANITLIGIPSEKLTELERAGVSVTVYSDGIQGVLQVMQ